MSQVYYVYLHRDFDGLIMYVGKGKGRRAWHKASRDSAHLYWIEECEHDYVEIVEEELTELQSFQLENRLLREEQPIFNKLRNY